MVEIIIKFPKKPRTIQRAKTQEIGRKYNYSEDEFYSIIKMDIINKDRTKRK